jgi:hypothetical protein
MRHHATRYMLNFFETWELIWLLRGNGEDAVSSFYLNVGGVVVLSSDDGSGATFSPTTTWSNSP